MPLRTLTSQEVWEARKSVKWPEPPVKDYEKVAGKVLPVYNFQEEGYRKAVDEANRLQAMTMLVRSIKLEISGETEAERLKTLSDKLGQYAFNKLIQAVSAINRLSEEAVAERARTFRPVRPAGASGNGETRPDSEPVAEPV